MSVEPPRAMEIWLHNGISNVRVRLAEIYHEAHTKRIQQHCAKKQPLEAFHPLRRRYSMKRMPMTSLAMTAGEDQPESMESAREMRRGKRTRPATSRKTPRAASLSN